MPAGRFFLEREQGMLTAEGYGGGCDRVRGQFREETIAKLE
jgi:hypothetical protein